MLLGLLQKSIKTFSRQPALPRGKGLAYLRVVPVEFYELHDIMYDIIMWSDMRGLQMSNKLPLLSLWQRNQETMRTGLALDFLQCKTSGANHWHWSLIDKLCLVA